MAAAVDWAPHLPVHLGGLAPGHAVCDTPIRAEPQRVSLEVPDNVHSLGFSFDRAPAALPPGSGAE